MDFWSWMGLLVQDYGYLGAFLISIVGNFTVFLPVPYALTIYAFGATLDAELPPMSREELDAILDLVGAGKDPSLCPECPPEGDDPCGPSAYDGPS